MDPAKGGWVPVEGRFHELENEDGEQDGWAFSQRINNKLVADEWGYKNRSGYMFAEPKQR